MQPRVRVDAWGEKRALAGALRNGRLSSLASTQAELERKEKTDFLGLVPNFCALRARVRDGWKAKEEKRFSSLFEGSGGRSRLRARLRSRALMTGLAVPKEEK
jgi:tellurite resistance protein